MWMTVTIIVMFVNFMEYVHADETIIIENEEYWISDPRRYEVTEPNPYVKYYARNIVFAPLWPLLLLRLIGRGIAVIMVDAFRSE